MGNGHSAIDKLIALTALKKYQEGGEVQPTIGQRFVQRFPSQHEERASEQERALANLIDLVMPQSVTDAGLMLAAGPLASKAGKAIKGARRVSKARKKSKKVVDEFYESDIDRQSRDWPDIPLSYRTGDDRLATTFLKHHGYSFYKGFGPKDNTWEYIEGGVRAYTPYKKGIKWATEQKTFKNPTLKALRDWQEYEGGGLVNNYQDGGQVLQIPQKKELDIVWPVDGESPEDMEQAKYNPVTELLLEALFEKLKRQQGQQRKPGKQLDPEAIKLYTIAQPDVV